MAPERTTPLISVVIVNYNGQQWMQRCLQSLADQTIFDQMEIIVSDTLSSGESDQFRCQRIPATALP